MAGHFETLSRICDIRSVDAQNREVLIKIVADQNVAAVRSKYHRLGQPADLAGAVAFFASSDSDFVTGQVLSVSGGLTMAG